MTNDTVAQQAHVTPELPSSDPGAVPEVRLGAQRNDSTDSIMTQGSYWETQDKEVKDLAPSQVIYIGVAITQVGTDPLRYSIGVTVHDGTYSIDYEVYPYPPPGEPKSDAPALTLEDASLPTSEKTSTPTSEDADPLTLEAFVVEKISIYGNEHRYKVLGGAITEEARGLCPDLPARLWRELDIVCFVFRPFGTRSDQVAPQDVDARVDEESDSVARKAIEQFGPNNLPRLMVKSGNKVCVDAEGQAHIASIKDYEDSVHENTWKATMHFAESLKAKKTQIAFFNSTPQGGGVALMRHALIRFLGLVDVDCTWYVPRPNQEVFRITKDNHNILQGVDQKEKGLTLTADKVKLLDDWCMTNAERYWTGKKGPLRPRSMGGADVVIVDDPQMPMLVEIAKQQDPERPVIFRSHIQVRGDLVDDETTAAAGVWKWIWNHVQKCDVFVSHPVPHFVPKIVPAEKVGYLPASTDWLDGLNKALSVADRQHYHHEFVIDILKQQLHRKVKFEFEYPKRAYIVQIARFDPAKGIDDVIHSYAKLRSDPLYMRDWAEEKIPQLVIAGHGAVDDPDATPIYNKTLELIETSYPQYQKDIIVMRVGPTDQILNALMRNSKVALQLSTREGFEVKVSEALHHGRPIIATNRGGIPLQVTNGQSGFIVNPSNPDYHSDVAKYLFHLFSDRADRKRMSKYARENVSDEVSTVGNALSWLYLADQLAKGEKVVPGKRWINDMARNEAGIPININDEVRLDRTLILVP